jgi:hypothetical protein
MDPGDEGTEAVVARGGAQRRGTRGAGAVSPVSSSLPRDPAAGPESSAAESFGPESSGNDPGTLAEDAPRAGSAGPESPSPLSVGPPGPGEHAALLALLGGALRRDPLLGWCLRVERPGYLGRLWNYLESMMDRHRALGRPLQVCRWQGQPAGVLLGCGPEDRIGPEEVRELRTRLAIACGREEARRLFEAHGALAPATPRGPCHRVLLLAVALDLRRRGVASALLGWLHGACDVHPGSEGVLAEAASPEAAAFLGRRGYRLLRQVALTGLRLQLLHRPRAPGAGGRPEVPDA